jgi:O-acetyl-ADP-ribose deacetylase (regulator of RNase III)
MIRVVLGELRDQRVDGLMRPVRSDLAPVSGPSRDVVLDAGEELQERLGRMGLLPVGGAVLTPAGLLPAPFLIHAVVMSEEEPQTSISVQRALRNGLRRASDWGLVSLALPPFGMAVGTEDPEDSARVLIEILFNHLDEGVAPLDLTIVVSSDFESELFGRLVEESSRARSASRN